jgi:hypothetical protein
MKIVNRLLEKIFPSKKRRRERDEMLLKHYEEGKILNVEFKNGEKSEHRPK